MKFVKKVLRALGRHLKELFIIEDYSDLQDQVTETTLWRNYHNHCLGRIQY